MTRGTEPLLAGVTAGGIGALVTALVSLVFHSPDAVFFNSLTAGLMTLILGVMAGFAWMRLGTTPAGRRWYPMIWAVAGVVVLVGIVALNGVLDGLVAYAWPLEVLAFVVTGGLTPVVSPRLTGLPRIAAPVVAAVVGLAASAALAGQAEPPRELAALPPPTLLAAASTEAPTRVERPVAAPSSVPSVIATVAPSPVLVVAAPSRALVRQAGQYAGVNFAVGSGSKVTFTVHEQLARMPLPNDAVVSGTGVTGDVHLDGRPSVIQLDLQRLSSDQPNRDKYIRTSMFPGDKTATFTVDDPRALPEGTPRGQTLAGNVAGMLAIKGGSFPLSFDWQARDDGDMVYVMGHTTFTWKDLGLETPNSAAIVSADDQVNCDVLLATRPK